MTDFLARPAAHGGPWTVDDLVDLDHDRGRYEIYDGSLVLNPPPPLSHGRLTDLVADSLKAQVPAHLVATGVGLGLGARGKRSYFVPDVVVAQRSALVPGRKQLEAPEVLLVVEVLSPSNSGTDLVLKRHEYAAIGIPAYWIVDPAGRTVTVLELAEGPAYAETAVLKPGDTWATDRPFPLTVAPAEFFEL